jgi:hypothetical protein
MFRLGQNEPAVCSSETNVPAEVPAELQNALKPIIRKLKKFDINILFDGYFKGILYYHVNGFSNNTCEERLITGSILKLINLRVKGIHFEEVNK